MPPRPFRGSNVTTLYDPPIEEFSVLLTKIGKDQEENHDSIDGPSILIVTEGSGTMQEHGKETDVVLDKAGVVYFVAAGGTLRFKGGDNGLTFYRAFVEVS